MTAREPAPVAWDKSLNLSAYDTVETMSNYASLEDLERYRALLFEKSLPALDFIAAHLPARDPLAVVEFCSGSGRLLYSLEQRGLLDCGYGIEVSPSRYGFAESWKRDLGFERTTNIHQPAADFVFPHDGFDLVIMIDGALSYLYPCDPGLPERLLAQSHANLAPGGVLLLESAVMDAETMAFIRRHGAHRTYIPGDQKDPFSFALYQTEPVDWAAKLFKNTSTYISRATGGRTVKEELYKYFEPEELTALLGAKGYRVSHFSSFGGAPFTAASDMLVTLAVKERA